MFQTIRNFIFSAFVALATATTVSAQMDATNRNREEPPKNVLENLAKMRIEQEKKDFEDLVKRTEEAVDLSNELSAAIEKGQMSAADRKKLDKLEKLVKKIRNGLGADDDSEDRDEAFPQTVGSAIDRLRSSATSLLKEIKSSTRYSISVAAVQSSNLIMRLLKFIKVTN